MTAVSEQVALMVVEPSALRRERLRAVLAQDGRFDVRGMVPELRLAEDRLARLRPDAVLVGLGALPELEQARSAGTSRLKLPIILLTEPDRARLARHWAAGTLIVPDAGTDAQVWLKQLSDLLRRVGTRTVPGMAVAAPRTPVRRVAIIAIGASTGGTIAIESILTALAPPMPPIVVTQHINSRFASSFANRLDQITQFRVLEASEGTPLEPDHVYVAPGDDHLSFVRFSSHIACHLLRTERINGHRPSVDVMFASVAKIYGSSAAGVLLTGMGRDGAQGLSDISGAGGSTVVQDRETSVVWSMPQAAIELGAAQKTVPLPNIPATLRALLDPSAT